MPSPSSTRQFVLSLARTTMVIVLALLGQHRLEQSEPKLFTGLALFVAAAVLLWMPDRLAAVWSERRYRPALALFALSVAALGGVLYWHDQMLNFYLPGMATTRIVIAWLIGITAFLVACRRMDRVRDDLMPHHLNWTRTDTFLMVGTTLLALALRASILDRAPLTFSGDEAQMAMEAVRVGKGQIFDPFITGWLSHPTLWFFLQSFSMSVFGDSIGGVRMLSALLGSAGVAGTYFFARLLYNRRIAAITALLLATYHFHIHFSRMALNNIADPLFGTLILSCLILGLRTRRFLMFGLAGLLLGLALYFYPGARLFVVLVFVVGLIRLVPYLRRKPEARPVNPWLPIALIGVGMVVAAAPLLQTFVQRPHDFMARMTVEGISMQWLQGEMTNTGQTALQILWNQFTHAAFAFNSYPDSSHHYASGRPLLWGLAAALMLLGLLYALLRLRRWPYQIPVLWFALSVFFGGMMLRLPPGSARYVTLAPVACLFIAFAVTQLLHEIEAALPQSTAPRSRSLVVKILGAAIVAYLSVASVHSYFNEYIPRDRLGGPNTHAANALAVYLSKQPPQTRVYFLGSPRMYYNGFAMLQFMARDVTGQDVTAPIQSIESVPVAASNPTIYAVLPERMAEMTIIQKRYPGGELKPLKWPAESGPLVYVYKVLP